MRPGAGNLEVAGLVVALGFSAVVIAPLVEAQECPEVVGRWPFGPVFAVSVSDNLAFYGSGAALLIADISRPSEPRLLGSVTLPGVVRGVAIAGRYAFVADELAGVRVIDVSNPWAPVEISSVATEGAAYAVAVAEGFLYLGDMARSMDRAAHLRVIDVQDPTAPVEVGHSVPLDATWDVTVSGNHVFVAEGSEGDLAIFDVGDPSNPTLVSVGPSWCSRGVAVSDNTAYVADACEGLVVLDVGDPTAPTVLSRLGLPGAFSTAIAFSEGFVYIAETTDSPDRSGLAVIDVRDPMAPVLVGESRSPRDPTAVLAAGSLALVGDRLSGLRFFDVADTTAPQELAINPSPGAIRGYDVAGIHAVVLDDRPGLWLVDISAPAAPRTRGALSFVGDRQEFGSVHVDQTQALVADGELGLRIIDISRPATPVELGLLGARRVAVDVEGSGIHAYVVDDGLRVVDVSRPSSPVEVGFFPVDELANRVDVSGNLVFLTSSAGPDDTVKALRILDVSDPSQPAEVGSLEMVGGATDVAVTGDFALLMGAFGGGMRVINVGDPSAPVEVAVVDPPDLHLRYLDFAGTSAWVTGWADFDEPSNAVAVIDVQVPWAPMLKGVALAPGDPGRIAAAPGLAITTDYWAMAGFRILRGCSPVPPRRGPNRRLVPAR